MPSIAIANRRGHSGSLFLISLPVFHNQCGELAMGGKFFCRYCPISPSVRFGNLASCP
jgi:hypothetical protein